MINITKKNIHNMKAYKLEVLIIDHDNMGADLIKFVLQNANFPNDCITPHVMSVTEKDIGEWTDDHPLNKNSTIQAAYEALFNNIELPCNVQWHNPQGLTDAQIETNEGWRLLTVGEQIPSNYEYWSGEWEQDGCCAGDRVGEVNKHTTMRTKQPISFAPKAFTKRVKKTGGSFEHTGTVVAKFRTSKGDVRNVVEFDAPVSGMLHIYRPDQLISI